MILSTFSTALHEGSTLPHNLDAFDISRNDSKLESSLRYKFKDKNKQIKEYCKIDTSTIYRKLLVIKTSQEEYQDGHEIVKSKTEILLKSGKYPYIQEVLILYDVKPTFHWLS